MRCQIKRTTLIRAIAYPMRKKLIIWLKAVRSKRQEISALLNRYMSDSDSVTEQDWEDMAQGSYYKIKWILAKAYPREDWPDDVPYLNLIARLKKKEQGYKKQLEERERRHTENMEKKDKTITKLKRFNEMVRKTAANQASYPIQEWTDAYEGTDILENKPEFDLMEEVGLMVEGERHRKTFERLNRLVAMFEKTQAREEVYSVKEWEDALEGTNVVNPVFGVIIEDARRREAEAKAEKERRSDVKSDVNFVQETDKEAVEGDPQSNSERSKVHGGTRKKADERAEEESAGTQPEEDGSRSEDSKSM
jgi:hypothetical protein